MSPRSWVSASLGGLALTSLFSDVGHEIATSVLPMYLASLGLGASVLGAVEGIADLVSGLAKLGGGAAGQVLHKKKPVTALCYLLTGIGTAGMALVKGAAGLVSLRSIAWAARGFRGPLKDFLVADTVEATHYGRAFGLERAGDMLGAVAGPLLAVLLLSVGLGLRSVMLLTVLPAALAAVTLLYLVREKPHDDGGSVDAVGGRGPLGPPRLPSEFWPLLTAIFVFGLGDFSRTFLILAATRAVLPEATPAVALAVAAPVAPVFLYVLHNAVSAAVTLPAGRLADALGRGPVLAGGYAVGAFTSLVLALGHGSLAALTLAFILSGSYIAVEETVEKALVAERLPRGVRSRGLGILAAANAVGRMVSSLYVGLLWDRHGAGTAFGTASLLAALGWLLLWQVERVRRRTAAAS